VTWDQWRAILWLRWRLTANQFARGSTLSAVILVIVVVFALLSGLSMFFVALVAGYFGLPRMAPEHVMFLWDGIIVGFLMFWMIGLVTELQRSELIALDRLMHLPLTLRGTFLLNYATSFVTLSMALFVPGMLGLSLASVAALGPRMLILFPMLFGFLLMVTALTCQLRGWLATLMVNKRRRRTIITVVTAVMIIVFQLPNLINLNARRWARNGVDGIAAAVQNEAAETAEWTRKWTVGEINAEEYQAGMKEIQARRDARSQQRQAARDDQYRQAVGWVSLANMVLPPGWLPYGAMSAADSRILPGLLAALASCLIGTGSLWRAYRTTLRLYLGEFQGTAPAKPSIAITDTPGSKPAVPFVQPATTFLERELPRLSEPCAAIALANFRSLTRAPEVKMMLLTPVMLLAVFGISVFRVGDKLGEAYRPLAAFGAISMTMFCMIGLVQNQFGFDRSGFRTYVLSGTPRRDVLLGKNLALAPFALGTGLLVVVAMQFLLPLRIGHLIGAVLQLASVYLLLCGVGNFSSILAPWAISPGSLKPANPKGLVILWSVLFALLFPFVSTLALIPLGLDALAAWLGWGWIPISPLLSAIGLALFAFAYLQLLTWQGHLLARRETRILELVTTKDE